MAPISEMPRRELRFSSAMGQWTHEVLRKLPVFTSADSISSDAALFCRGDLAPWVRTGEHYSGDYPVVRYG
jgi:hypothetical protein